MAYWHWPSVQADAPTAFCVHGLTRNGRDFDFLAEALCGHAENLPPDLVTFPSRLREGLGEGVINPVNTSTPPLPRKQGMELKGLSYNILCPDIAGRGESDWLSDTKNYHYGTYFTDLLALLEARKLTQVDWVGTSMGGILGMWMAAMQPQRIHKLVLNDIGAVIPRAGLERINRYVGMEMEFSDHLSAETKLREVFAPFGLNAEWQWEHLLEHSFRKLSNGSYQLAYDPAILDPVRDAAKNLAGEGDTLLWEWWDKIQCPILVLRGENSDILTAPILEEMLARNPHAASLTFPNVGHAPALMDAEQIRLVKEWLLS